MSDERSEDTDPPEPRPVIPLNYAAARDYGAESGGLVTLSSFATATEAGLAQSRLAFEGIRSYLDNENLIAANPLLANATGGVKLKVSAEDLERAREVLETPPSLDKEDLDEDDGYTDEAWRCPKCHHKRVELSRLPPGLFWPSLLLLGVPLLFIKRTKHCLDCGHHWQAQA
jgi:hypothetical protein